MGLPSFKYSYLAGPLPKDRLKQEIQEIKEGNCRLAVQVYFYNTHNVYFEPEKILNPNGYKNTGEFVFKVGDVLDFKEAKTGDVIYAENIVNKKGETISKSRSAFDSEDDWILHFHTAIYLGSDQVWHATNLEENSCFWNLEKFNKFYKPVALKRFLA